MPALTAGIKEEIAGYFAKGDVGAGYARLAQFADVKAADLPALDKKALAALGGDAEATRQFAAGLLSSNESVRRMARKFTAKLAAGPGAMLRLAFETMRPFRRVAGDGLAGDYGGYATPLGPEVLDAGLSFEIKNPTVAVYSPATRVMREAVENLAGALLLAPPATWVRVLEYAIGLTRPYARHENYELPTDLPPGIPSSGGFFALGALHAQLRAALQEKLKKQDEELLRALERWSACRLLLDEPAPAGSAEEAVQRRWHALPELERTRGAATLAVTAADHLRYTLSPSLAAKLYQRLRMLAKMPTEGHEKLMAGSLKMYTRENPEAESAPLPAEAPRLAPPAAAPAAKPAKGARTATAPAAPVAAVPHTDAPVFAHPHEGPSQADCLDVLVRLARELGAPASWKQAIQDADHDWYEESDTPTAGPLTARAEPLLAAARATVMEKTRTEKSRATALTALFERRYEDTGVYVPEDELARASWAEPLAPLLAGLEPAAALTGALTLLPPRLVEAHADAWRAAATRLDDHSREPLRELILKVAAARAPALASALGPVLASWASVWAPIGAPEWELAAACLYVSGGAAGRAAVADALRASKPPEKQIYYRRHLSGGPMRYLFREAWKRRDAAFLGAAFASLMVPIYFKGKRPLIPFEERLRYHNYAPNEGTAPPGEELPLADVWTFVAAARPEDAAQALALAGTCATYEKGARALLDVAAKQPASDAALARRLSDLVGVLEAPDAPAVRDALDTLARIPERLTDHLDEIFAGLARAAAATSPGLAQAALRLAAALGQSHPARRADAAALLEDGLHATNLPTIEEALRGLARCGGITAAGRAQVAKLATREPARLARLCAALT